MLCSLLLTAVFVLSRSAILVLPMSLPLQTRRGKPSGFAFARNVKHLPRLPRLRRGSLAA
jgi:hypothetical protein